MEFDPDEKLKAFDKIAALYFEKNFGKTSKADIETLLFSIYIEHRLKENLDFDDYTLSKELGITQNRIRSLKERKELQYPHEGFDWRTPFSNAVKNARYDEEKHRVKILIEDINVQNEIRHFVEQNGWYDECSLNKKLIVLPLDCFLEICTNNEDITPYLTDEAKNNIKKIDPSDRCIRDLLADFSKNGLKKFLMTAGKETLAGVLQTLPFSGLVKIILQSLANSITK